VNGCHRRAVRGAPVEVSCGDRKLFVVTVPRRRVPLGVVDFELVGEEL
jgi:hypothetical protein